MTTKNETIGNLALLAISRIGLAIIVFWILELFWNEKRHPWLQFNLDHPVVMIAGLSCAAFALYRLAKKYC